MTLSRFSACDRFSPHYMVPVSIQALPVVIDLPTYLPTYLPAYLLGA